MTEEIKKILDRLKDNDFERDCNDGSCYKELYLSEIEKLLNYITNLRKENQSLKNNYNDNEQAIHKIMEENERLRTELNGYKSRNEKAVEYIEDNLQMNVITGSEYFASYSPCTDLLNILEGGDE